MKTFSGFLLETLNTKPVEWNKSTDQGYRFKIDGNTYNVFFERYDSETVEMELSDPEVRAAIHDSGDGYETSFGVVGGKVGITMTHVTGTGNQFLVFATVIDCIKDFMNNKGKNASFLYFAADKSDRSRGSLYGRMLKRQLKSLGGTYTIYKDQKHPQYTYFVLVNEKNIAKHKEEEEKRLNPKKRGFFKGLFK